MIVHKHFKTAGALILFTFCFLSCKNSSKPATATKRPNILLVLADDQSWLHTGIMGDKVVKTPGFDRIAREGVLFNNAFTSCPSCTPSRTGILSGQDVWRTKQAGLLMGSVPPDLPLFTHILDSNGYSVGYTGKGWAPGDWSSLGLKEDPLVKAYNSRMEVEIADGIDKRNYTDNFKDFLKDRPKDKPFFFWFGSTEPHREYQYGVGQKEAGMDITQVQVPAFLPDNKVVRKDIMDYYYEIMWYDSHLVGILDELEKAGELENTIIIVTSDNGMPFPRAKANLYDWGTHMPMAIRWGSKVKPGRVVDDFVDLTDLAPTILQIAGLKISSVMTGRSLLSILTSDKSGVIDSTRNNVVTGIERHTYCRPDGATYPSRAIRTKDFLYIRNFEPDRWPTGGPDFISSNKTTHGDVDASPTKSFIVMNQKTLDFFYQLDFGKRPGEELYDVHKDIGEMHNLANDPAYASVKEKLSKELEAYLRKTNDPRIEGKDPWQNYVYYQETGFGSTYNKDLPEYERARAKLRPSDHPDLQYGD